MTPEQLRFLREQRDLTRDQLAEQLNCSAGAIVQWEGGKRGIPPWVEEKMLKSLPLNYTFEELTELIEYAREMDEDLPTLLKNSIKLLLDLKRQGKPLPAHPEPLPPRQGTVIYAPGREGLGSVRHGLNESTPTAAELEQELNEVTSGKAT